MDSKRLARLCRELADHKKAEDIIVLDVRGKVVMFEIDSDSGLNDAFVARVTKVLGSLRFPKA